MTKTNHPIEREELMAYLDGELATDRAITAAAHLEHCQECQGLTSDLKGVSQKLMEWEVEPSDSEIMPDVAAALTEREKQPQKTAISHRRDGGVILRGRWLVWAGGLAVVAFLALSIPNLLRSRRASEAAKTQTYTYDAMGNLSAPPPPPGWDRKSGAVTVTGSTSGAAPALSASSYSSSNSLTYADATNGRLSYSTAPPLPQGTPRPSTDKNRQIDGQNNTDEVQGVDAIEPGDLSPAKGPLIVRTAGLIVTTKEYDKARVALEEILKRHHGYMGQLNVSAPSEAGRTLTATLRVPADQLDATLTELKTLGRVEGESQGGEEVTQQYVDLQARLANAKHMEQRLTDILRQRTGKLSDVLAVEVQIGRVRGEIERMQAEKKELAKQVQFATLNATVKEDYKAPMQMAPASTSNRFHNAAVDGYKAVVEGLVDVLLFLLSAGPSLLVWAAILFFPVRWAWRKLRKNPAKGEAPAAS